MQRPKKADIEMVHGKALLDLLKIDASLEPGQVPAPDLLFSHGGVRIGIEHTRMFSEVGSKAGSFQAYENRIDELAERCRAEYEKRNLPSVEVKLHLSHQIFPKLRLVPLVDWVVKTVGANPQTGEMRNEWDGAMPAEINTIRIFRFQKSGPSHFFCPRAAWMMPLEVSKLQMKVDEKAERMEGYRKACNEVWLLIVEDQAGLASTMDVSTPVWSEPIRHEGFSRVYYMRGRAEVHRLLSTT